MTLDEAAEGGQVAAPYAGRTVDSAVLETLLDQGADMGCKLWPPSVEDMVDECKVSVRSLFFDSS